jgi:hypothetical protein
MLLSPPRLSVTEGIMRSFRVLIGFVLLSLLATAPAGAAKLGETCDGIAAIQCDAGLWCEHPAGQCNVADASGTCVKELGPFCEAIYLPVCGCDGKTYSNDCERKRDKVQLDHIGECEK